MLSGYISFFFTDYSSTFVCSTVGAFNGAVFMRAFGWGPVGSMLLIRLGYVLLGILAALLANCVLLPFKRSNATRQLVRKYRAASLLLSEVCKQPKPDSPLYGLIIQTYLQEQKLRENARELNWKGAKKLFRECRNVYLARMDALPLTH